MDEQEYPWFKDPTADIALMLNGYLVMADAALGAGDIATARAWSDAAKAAALTDCAAFHDEWVDVLQAWCKARGFSPERAGMEFWKLRQGKASFAGDDGAALRESPSWTKPLPAVDSEGEKFFR